LPEATSPGELGINPMLFAGLPCSRISSPKLPGNAYTQNFVGMLAVGA
jgi:hypothetical protein